MRISKKYKRRSIIFACFAAVSLSGALMCYLGDLKPWLFAILLLPATVSASCVRTPGANLMLEQQKGDSGSASSLMSSFGIFMGSIGMIIISLNWDNTIVVLGLLNVLIGLTCVVLWILISQKPFIKQVPERFAVAAAK
jgi:DHA1 family bicyclomycin/chloramphenicol resistance-like MFS transporter